MHNRSDSVAVTIAKECTNRAIRRIAERDHPHFRQMGYIPLVAAYSSGTIAIANGGTIVSGTNATWSSAYTGDYMKIGDDSTHYQLTSYTSAASGPSFALDGGAKWLGDTITSGTYTIYRDTYSFPSDYRTMGKFVEASLLTDVDWFDAEDAWYLNKMQNAGMTGPPRWACLENDKLRLWPYETNLSNLSFIYYRWPTDMVNDADVMDFPDPLIDLVRAAIRAEVAIERGKDEDETMDAFEKKEKKLNGAAAHPHASFTVGSGMPEYVTQAYVIGSDTEL
jgi:hypothetical protein